jgi:hypothetical protein
MRPRDSIAVSIIRQGGYALGHCGLFDARGLGGIFELLTRKFNAVQSNTIPEARAGAQV